MSSTTFGAHAHDAAGAHEHGHAAGFLRTYVFSLDHKVIGVQFLFSTLLWFLVGGLLAMAVRWQLAWPWTSMPIIGPRLFAGEGGQISPEFYTMLFTMHVSIMIFFVIFPILAGAFGNFLIPLMIGADDMAFPTLNMLSYWFMWPAFVCMTISFFVPGGASNAGWTGYPPLSAVDSASPGSLNGQTYWLIGLIFVGISSMMGSVNYMTTIIQMRAPGMTMFRLPMTIWAVFITAILQAFALPVLTAALFMQVLDRVLHTGFFVPEGLIVNGVTAGPGGGQPLLWQHLFWFYSHPAVYIMILPAMGMVSDMISCFSRKPLFGYKPMVYSIAGIAGLGFIVWGHHMFMSGMNPALGMTFMVSTMMIALPSAIKVFNWLGTVWGGKLQFTTPMLFALSFVSMFNIGGLSGIFMAATPVDIFIHDTYFIVGHIHYVLFGGSVFAIFAGVYFWFPKMFGRMMNERLGKIHFWLTFVGVYCIFMPMHYLGYAGDPRRYSSIESVHYLFALQPVYKFISIAALITATAQLFFYFNFFWSIKHGKPAERNPWRATTLEWQVSTPVPHDNFAGHYPTVYRGPYEYSVPGAAEDFIPQDVAPEQVAKA